VLEIPILQELKAEWMREAELRVHREYTLRCLEARFGVAALELEPLLKAINDERFDDEMIKLAATCRSLASFRKKLSPRSR